MIPSIAIVHVANPHWRGIRLWLPLFLLWIPALLLAPFVLLILLVVCLRRRNQLRAGGCHVLGNSMQLAGDGCPR